MPVLVGISVRNRNPTVYSGLNEMSGQITDFLKNEVKTETIIGQQFQLGDFTCFHVMSVGLVFGESAGKGKAKSEDGDTGIGGGVGIGMGPIGFLQLKDVKSNL